MLIQTSTPRVLFDPLRHPQYIHIHTLAKVGVSTGMVRLSGPVDPEFGVAGGRIIEPVNSYAIDGEEGFLAHEHVLPFWLLFKRAEGFQEAVHDGMVVRSADIGLVRYCTAGFGVVAKSAFRAGPRSYEEHTVTLKLQFPPTGGGVIRLADVPFDISNSAFDPFAPDPHPPANEDLRISYNRTHQLGSSTIDARRAARVAAAEASMAREASDRTFEMADNPRALPPKR